MESAAATPPVILPGRIFHTPFERGCVALEAPDAQGCFRALDSDGVECRFFLTMVESTEDAPAVVYPTAADARTPPVVLPEAHELLEPLIALYSAEARITDLALTPGTPGALYLGRLVEAISHATDALFNVINTASSYCECPTADAASARWLAREWHDGRYRVPADAEASRG